MTYTLKRYHSYQEYLEAEDLSSELNYRLLSTGEVIEVPTENELNRIIVCALIVAILKVKGMAFLPYICRGDKEIQVHPEKDKRVNRKPDLMVLNPVHISEAKQAIFLGMPAPAFVAEIVSPGSPSTENFQRDYVWKRRQYEDWQIPEYWIIDPHQEQVTVLTLVNGAYQEAIYTGESAVASTVFPSIEITVDALIEGRIDED